MTRTGGHKKCLQPRSRLDLTHVQSKTRAKQDLYLFWGSATQKSTLKTDEVWPRFKKEAVKNRDLNKSMNEQDSDNTPVLVCCCNRGDPSSFDRSERSLAHPTNTLTDHQRKCVWVFYFFNWHTSTFQYMKEKTPRTRFMWNVIKQQSSSEKNEVMVLRETGSVRQHR